MTSENRRRAPVIIEHAPRTCFLVTVDHASRVDLAPLGERLQLGEPFVCVVWDAAGGSTEDERVALGRQLVAAGCRYTVSGGEDCVRWHNDMDEAFVELPAAEWQARFLMSTWHTGESVEEVVWFAVNCTNFDRLIFRKWLLVLRGGNQELYERLVAATRREIAEADEVDPELEEDE